MIKTKRINNEIVKPIPISGGAKIPALGSDLFEEPYANIFITAKKNTGKSTVIYNILKKCAGHDTNIIMFASTLNKDKNLIAIKEYSEKHCMSFSGYTSIIENGQNHLEELILSLQIPIEESDSESEDEMPFIRNGFGKLQHKQRRKPRPPKYIVPEYILIFDDMSSELKAKTLETLLKNMRHFNMKVIISSQYLLDIPPASRRQLDYWLVFAGMSEEKLEMIHRDADIGIDFDKFDELYHYATKERRSFLYIDQVNQTFRKNFNIDLTIKE